MNWQEYQAAVGELYIQAEGIGNVRKNIAIPDRITGQPRQVDVWIEVQVKTHTIGILIDAKYRKEKIDVKDVEEVASLAGAVGADKCVLVALNGWTQPAEIKAKAINLDLRILTLDEALELIVKDKWMICSNCNNDCIVMDCSGGFLLNNLWSLLAAGRCRECKMAHIWCWSCGEHADLILGDQYVCNCEHIWKNDKENISVKPYEQDKWNIISKDVPLLDTGAADQFIAQAYESREQGDYDLAIKSFTNAINCLPIAAPIYYERGMTFDEIDYLDEAIADYTACISLDPLYAMAYGSRGIALYAQGRLKEAISDLKQYLTLTPNASDRDMLENAIAQAQAAILLSENSNNPNSIE